MFGLLRKAIMGLAQRWHAAARSHYLIDHDEIEAIRQRAIDTSIPAEERRKELDWLRSYQRELDGRITAMERDAKVDATRRARLAGHD